MGQLRRSGCHYTCQHAEEYAGQYLDANLHGEASRADRKICCGSQPRLCQHGRIMPNRPFKLPLFVALRESFRQGYSFARLRGDVLAGITVGIIAIPLAMALAIAVGVAPQHGLYTGIVGGLLIALCGGSRFNISGPTAAFVVILLPITQQHGLGGLLLVTMMAGMILLMLGLARLGNLIQFVPYPVVMGFTAGIGVVIATLQIKDFFGLQLAAQPSHYLEQWQLLISALPSIQPGDT